MGDDFLTLRTVKNLMKLKKMLESSCKQAIEEEERTDVGCGHSEDRHESRDVMNRKTTLKRCVGSRNIVTSSAKKYPMLTHRTLSLPRRPTSPNWVAVESIVCYKPVDCDNTHAHCITLRSNSSVPSYLLISGGWYRWVRDTWTGQGRVP